MENNRDFIKGGLPLGSRDFVNPENVRQKKSRLLAALDNISKIHDEKMYSAMTDNSAEANTTAIDNTLNMMGNEPTQPAAEFTPTAAYNPNEYATEATLGSIFDQLPADNDFNNAAPAFSVPADENNAFNSFNPVGDGDPMPYQMDENGYQQPAEYQAVDEYQSFNPETDSRDFPHDEFTPAEQSEQVESSEYPQQQYDNSQGNPEFVVDDAKVGKRAKGKGAMSGDAKKGRFVAWMAYIVFFIPLLFAGKNSFVRHHANEGLCINILDALGVGLYFVSQKLTHDVEAVRYAILGCGLLGILLLCITLFSRVILILGALAGKKSEAPLFGKVKFIK